MRAVQLVAVAWLAVCLVGGAFAAPITLVFTGTVSQASPQDPAVFGGAIDFGTAFAGRYTYDPGASDAVADAQTGSYRSVGAPYALSLEFGGSGFFGVSFNEIAIGIGNDFSGADFYTFIAPLVAPDIGMTASLVMIDSDGRVFGSDALPAGAPVLGEFETRDFSLIGSLLDGDGGTTQIEILGTLDTLACVAGCNVPEPGSLLLVATGLAALLARRQPSRVPVRPDPRPHQPEERP